MTRRALDVVEAVVAQRDAVGGDVGRRAHGRARARGAAHLEDVGEVGGEAQRQRHAQRRASP